MGGEKLYTIRIVFLAVIIAAGVSIFPFSSFAQEAVTDLPTVQQPAASGSVDTVAPVSEESIILDEEAAVTAETETGGVSVWVFARIVLTLAISALAIYGVVFFFKRLARPPAARDPNLKVLASVPLGGDTFASVVSLGTKAWLVGGGTGAGVSLIAEIDDPETIETLLLEDARKSAETGMNRLLDFKALLNRFGNKKNNAGRSGAETFSAAEALRKQRERLKGLEP